MATAKLRRRKRGGRRVLISFLATVTTLFLFVFVALNLAPGVPTYHLPSKIPTYGGVLATYAPIDSLQVSLDNLSAIRALNKSVLANTRFLNILDPQVGLTTGEMNVRITIALSQPNSTVNVALLRSDGYLTIADAFTSFAQPPTMIGNLSAYSVADNATGRKIGYWLTLVPNRGALIFSQGALEALSGIRRIVGVMNGAVDSILSNADVARMLYVVNGTNHLAMGIQNFPGVVRTGLGTLISVDSKGQSIEITYVIRFNGTATATSQVKTVKADFLAARQFAIYDELVKAVEVQPLSGLRNAIALVG